MKVKLHQFYSHFITENLTTISRVPDSTLPFSALLGGGCAGLSMYESHVVVYSAKEYQSNSVLRGQDTCAEFWRKIRQALPRVLSQGSHTGCTHSHPRMSCNNMCLPGKFFSNWVPNVLIGAPSASHVFIFQVIRRKGGLCKPYCLCKHYRHS